RLLMAADVGLAVGPLLYQRLNEIRGGSRISGMLIPGLGEQAAPVQPIERINAITFGRFDTAEFLTKQAPLATAAFAKAIRMGFESHNKVLMDSSLRVVGAPIEVGHELRKLAEAEAGRVWNLQLLEYIDDRSQL